MVVSKTPLRISLLGGGTDFPAWYKREGKSGLVLSTTINKYSYITCRKINPFFDNHKLVYHEIEYVPKDKIEEIRHPSIRETFKFLNIKESLFINYDTDLPARSGLGSSSAFTVGLLNALHTLDNYKFTKQDLYEEAIHIEQDLIGENVGSQDQVATACGGLNTILFIGNSIYPNRVYDEDVIKELESSLMLFFTGYTRLADSIEKDKIDNMKNNEKYYDEMFDLTKDFIGRGMPVHLLYWYLQKTWALKKNFSNRVSNNTLDDIYQAAIDHGAEGGKLLGSGGGGFFLFVSRTEKMRARLRETLKNLKEVPFKFENKGSHIIFNNGEQ